MKQLIQALNKAAKSVGYVQKKGHNDFHKYAYATEADVITEVRGALLDNGIVLLPSVKEMRGPDERGMVSLLMEYTIMHESGEMITFVMAGCGQDKGDKGVYKAATGANKYALLKLLQLSTGDDAEKEEPSQPKVSPKSVPPTAVVKPADNMPAGESTAIKIPSTVSIEDEKGAIAFLVAMFEEFIPTHTDSGHLRKFFADNRHNLSRIEKVDSVQHAKVKALFVDQAKLIEAMT